MQDSGHMPSPILSGCTDVGRHRDRSHIMVPLGRPLKRLLRAVPAKSGTRGFAASSNTLANFVARTTTSPWPGSSIQAPRSFAAKSVVLLSTPSNLPHVIEAAISLHQAKIQVVVAGVDRVVPNGAKNGVSELWLDEKVQIKSAKMTEKEPEHPQPKESDGIHAVGAKVPWKTIQGSITFRTGIHTIALSLANTLFATKTATTLFYFDTEKSDTMGQTLAELDVQLPALALHSATFTDRWTPLAHTEPLHVTRCTGNLIKSINKQPASSFLEKNTALMSIASKSTKVYVKVFSGTQERRHEVIAGGGGWGAKADLLALSPDARVKVGDRLEFYMITPNDRYTPTECSTAVVSGQFLFESPIESTSFDTQTDQQTVEGLFGGGSESGLIVDGISRSSPGESVCMRY